MIEVTLVPSPMKLFPLYRKGIGNDLQDAESFFRGDTRGGISMKRTLLATALVAAFCGNALAQITDTLAERPFPAGTFVSHYAPGQDYTITVESEDGIVSTLTVPRGAFLSVQATTEHNPDYKEAHGIPREFRGDIVIRTRLATEVAPDESRSAPAIMSKAPVAMTVKNAVVLVERSKEGHP